MPRKIMQTAFHLLEAGPASAARRFSRVHCTGAVNTADAGIISLVQTVVGKLTPANMVPNCLHRPIHQRIDLDQSKLHLAGECTRRRLLPADTGDPGPQF